MNVKTKKVLLTILDIVIVLIAACWCFYLVVYFSQSIDGGVFISDDYAIFERNYLVPLQIFGIAIISTIVSIVLYSKLRKKGLISRRYIILVLFNIIPFLINCVFQIANWISYWNTIY